MASLNYDWGRSAETWRQPGDFDFDVVIKTVDSVRADGEFFAAARINDRIGPGEGYFEIRFGLSFTQSDFWLLEYRFMSVSTKNRTFHTKLAKDTKEAIGLE